MAWCSLRPDRRSQRVAPELAALLARHGIDKTDLDPGLLRQLSGQLSDAADPALKEKRLADIDALLRAQAFLGGNA